MFKSLICYSLRHINCNQTFEVFAADFIGSNMSKLSVPSLWQGLAKSRVSGFLAGLRVENSGSGLVSGQNLKSGPGSWFEIKFFSRSKKPGSKISRPGRLARCRALLSGHDWAPDKKLRKIIQRVKLKQPFYERFDPVEADMNVRKQMSWFDNKIDHLDHTRCIYK